ncbi:MAG: hypothetical protein ABI443_09955 [Chthoniobacterales bacterium]
MITPTTGEIGFADGLSLGPHAQIDGLQVETLKRRAIPVKGWSQVEMGVHPSDQGDFEIEISSGPENRVEAVFLSHSHSFYEAGTPEDGERRVFHDGVIARDLRGQHEFSWGNVFTKLDPKSNRDWIAIIYNRFPSISLSTSEGLDLKGEHESHPEDRESPPL